VTSERPIVARNVPNNKYKIFRFIEVPQEGRNLKKIKKQFD
jgi:hypothetical protein